MTKTWHARVSFDEALQIISEKYNLPESEVGIRVDFKATADKGLPSERIVDGYAVLKKTEHELIIESMIFTNS